MDRTCSCKMHCESPELTLHVPLRGTFQSQNNIHLQKSIFSLTSIKKKKRKRKPKHFSPLVCLSFFSSHRVNKSIEDTISLHQELPFVEHTLLDVYRIAQKLVESKLDKPRIKLHQHTQPMPGQFRVFFILLKRVYKQQNNFLLNEQLMQNTSCTLYHDPSTTDTIALLPHGSFLQMRTMTKMSRLLAICMLSTFPHDNTNSQVNLLG